MELRPAGGSEDPSPVPSKRRRLGPPFSHQMSQLDLSPMNVRGQGAASTTQTSPSTTQDRSTHSEDFDWDAWRPYIIYCLFVEKQIYVEVAAMLTKECAIAEDARDAPTIVILVRQVKLKLDRWEYGKHFHEKDLKYLIKARDDVHDTNDQKIVVRYRGCLKSSYQIRRHLSDAINTIDKQTRDEQEGNPTTTKRRKFEGWTAEKIRKLRDDYPGEYPTDYPDWFDFSDLSDEGKTVPVKPAHTRRPSRTARARPSQGFPSQLSTPDIPSKVIETGSQFNSETPFPRTFQYDTLSDADVMLDGPSGFSPFALRPNISWAHTLQVPQSSGQYDDEVSQFTPAHSSHAPTASSMTSADSKAAAYIDSFSFSAYCNRILHGEIQSDGRNSEYRLFQLLSGSQVDRIEWLDAAALESLSAGLPRTVGDESANSPEKLLEFCLAGLAFRGRNSSSEVERLANVSFDAAHRMLFSMIEDRNPRCLYVLHIFNILACCFGRGHAMGDLLGLRLSTDRRHNPAGEPVSGMLDLMVCFLKEESNPLEESLLKLGTIQDQLREQFPEYPIASMIAQLNHGWRAVSQDVEDENIRLMGHQVLLDLKGPLERELGHLEFTPIYFLVLLAKSASRLAPSSEHPFPLQEAFGFLHDAFQHLEAAKYPRYHPCYLEVMFRYGDYLLRDNNPIKALEVLSEVLEQRKNLFGADNVETKSANDMRRMALEALDLGKSVAENPFDAG